MKAIEKETSARFQSMDEFGLALKDPAKFAASPSLVAEAGAMSAAPTASVAVVSDTPSGPRSVANTDQATVIATKPKANTTLSGAASESSAVREPAAPKSGNGKRVAIIGGVAAAVAAAGLVAVLKLGGGGGQPAPATVTPPPVTAPPVAAVAPPKVENVEVALKSDPPGAQVVRADGVIVGVTPVTMKLEKGSPSLDVELTLEGYRAEKRTLTSDVNREVDVNLLKAPPAKREHAPKAVATKPAETKAPSTKPAESKPAETKKNDKPADPDKDLIPAQL